MRIALYARVSTSHQQQIHTIEQQLTRLRAYVTTQADWSLCEEHIFCDDGYSGAKLKRPGLDHLRDQAALGSCVVFSVKVRSASATFGFVMRNLENRSSTFTEKVKHDRPRRL